MAYLAKDDYTLHISIDHLDRILTQASTSSGKTELQILEEAEATAESEILSYLTGQYEIETELAKSATDTDRNRLIKKCMIDISLYHIFFTVNPRDIPESREKLYNHCIMSLKAYRNNELNFGLAVVDVDADGIADVGRFSFGSHKKFISRPFTDPILTEKEDNGNI